MCRVMIPMEEVPTAAALSANSAGLRRITSARTNCMIFLYPTRLRARMKESISFRTWMRA